MKALATSLLLLLYVPGACAQAGPVAGGHEVEVWTGGGANLPVGRGDIRDIEIWNAGVRFGWIIGAPHGPSILRGNFEYAIGASPAYLVFQPTGAAYGVTLEPVVFKLDFEQRRSVVLYFEISGDSLFTSQGVPDGISKINFASGGARGLHFLRKKYN